MTPKLLLSFPLLLTLGLSFPLLGRTPNEVVTGSLAVSSINNSDGVGAGTTTYTTYTGDGSTGAGWPAMSQWASFEDLFNNNKNIMSQSCGWNNWGENDSDDEIGDIYNALQSVAQATEVDHRFILAVMMQESKGCVRVITTDNGVRNPGLMQDHDGDHSCNDAAAGLPYAVPCPTAQITGMIQDGAGGTNDGDGLANTINEAVSQGKTNAQAFYAAARIYNSGSIASDGNLSDGNGATPCYASDIANRLMGWNDLDSGSCSL